MLGPLSCPDVQNQSAGERVTSLHPEPAFFSLSMDIVYHQVLGREEGWTQERRKPAPILRLPEELWAVHTQREGEGGLRRRRAKPQASSEPLPHKASCCGFIHVCVCAHTLTAHAHTRPPRTHTSATLTYITHKHTCTLYSYIHATATQHTHTQTHLPSGWPVT